MLRGCTCGGSPRKDATTFFTFTGQRIPRYLLWLAMTATAYFHKESFFSIASGADKWTLNLPLEQEAFRREVSDFLDKEGPQEWQKRKVSFFDMSGQENWIAIHRDMA